MTASTTPREIFKLGDDRLKIVWEDGHESAFAFAVLRRACPCAGCVDEWTGKPLLDPAAVPADLKGEKAELVGNYAVAIRFSDGHSAGIYTFERLRATCPCPACAGSSESLRPSP